MRFIPGAIASFHFALFPATVWADVPSPIIAVEPQQNRTQLPAQFPNELPYTLGAGDRLYLDVFNIPEYSQEYIVQVDGTLNLPLIGSLPVDGLTIPQAETTIAQLYTPVLTYPQIRITLTGMRPIDIGIVGEVSHPGAYQITPSITAQGVQMPTLIQALQLAAGITPAAEVRQIEVHRRVRGVEQIIAIDLQAFFQGGDLQQNLTLRDGDTIVVPAATEIDAIAARQRSTANFAADRTAAIGVAVVGAVRRPGSHTLNASETSVTRAIQTAGGVAPDADIRQIQVRRYTTAGSEQTLTVNLWELLQTGDLGQDVLLKEGDTVIVPKAEAINLAEQEQIAPATFAPDSIRVNVIGAVVTPGSVELSPAASIDEAFFAAGGFDDRRSQTGSLELVRLNANGTLSRQQLDIDLEQGFESEITLRDGDAIVVGRDRSLTETLGGVLRPLTPVFSLFDLLNGVF
jgi:polysaccharide export outer membrane protein